MFYSLSFLVNLILFLFSQVLVDEISEHFSLVLVNEIN